MINEEFLESCSDEQINKGVVWAKISRYKLIGVCKAQLAVDKNTAKNLARDINCGMFNPCEYPSDIIPIQIANRIGLISDDESIKPNWIAIAEKITGRHHEYYDIEVQNANPLRAICEVYILMSVEK
jgi:hypothetical protein